MRKLIALSLLCVTPAFGWGYVGHNMIGEVAARSFPSELPAFLRGPEAVARIGLLSQEPDESRNAGQPHDYDLDPGHFLDVSDDLTILEGPRLSAMPNGRRDYDTALRAVHFEQYKAGFLFYNILDGYQQLVKDFAYLRAYRASLKNAGKFKLNAADRRAMARLVAVRELLTLRDLGYWAHFVEDASQPMHVSVHYDGWGDGPNPDGFTTEHGLHSKFETAFVTANAKPADVAARLRPYHHCEGTAQSCLQDYIATVAPQVRQIYVFEKAGALDAPTPESRAFVLDRMADGASNLRDLVVDAWRESANAQLGYKVKTPVADYESGKAIMVLQSQD
jgi:hypothetical protein